MSECIFSKFGKYVQISAVLKPARCVCFARKNEAMDGDAGGRGNDDFLDGLFGTGLDAGPPYTQDADLLGLDDVLEPGKELVEQVQAAKSKTAMAIVATPPVTIRPPAQLVRPPSLKMRGFVCLPPTDAPAAPVPEIKTEPPPPVAPAKKPMITIIDSVIDEVIVQGVAPAIVIEKDKKKKKKKKKKKLQPNDPRYYLDEEAEESDHDVPDERSQASSEPEEGQSDNDAPTPMEVEDNPAKHDKYLADGFVVGDHDPIEYESSDEDEDEDKNNKKKAKKAKAVEACNSDSGVLRTVLPELPWVKQAPRKTPAPCDILETILRQVACFQLEQWSTITSEKGISACQVQISKWRYEELIFSFDDQLTARAYREYFAPMEIEFEFEYNNPAASCPSSPSSLSLNALRALDRMRLRGWLDRLGFEIALDVDSVFDLTYLTEDGRPKHICLTCNLLASERSLLLANEWSMEQVRAMEQIIFCHRPLVVLRKYLAKYAKKRHHTQLVAGDKFDKSFIQTYQQCETETSLFLAAYRDRLQVYIQRLLRAATEIVEIVKKLK